MGFRKSVDRCLTTLTKREVRLFARRHRRYILAYLGIKKAKDPDSILLNHSDDSDCAGKETLHLPDGIHLPEMSCQLVERIIKIFKQPHKCHRNIVDQDRKFLHSVAQWMKCASK